MKVSSRELNNGVIAFLGFGVDKFPHEHREKLITEFGAGKAGVIESEIISLLNESNQIPIDWTRHSLASAGSYVIERIREVHPELSERALNAIAWKFTFDWR